MAVNRDKNAGQVDRDDSKELQSSYIGLVMSRSTLVGFYFSYFLKDVFEKIVIYEHAAMLATIFQTIFLLTLIHIGLVELLH